MSASLGDGLDIPAPPPFDLLPFPGSPSDGPDGLDPDGEAAASP